ncbi:MAG: hypothetical protein JWQ56_1629, partial [Pseudarthrobacter sp.]|nr:hypothetical protein [Pseudarthrobacter sp.]
GAEVEGLTQELRNSGSARATAASPARTTDACLPPLRLSAILHRNPVPVLTVD